jgi:glucosamine-6-phosphate deaminase
MRIFHESSYDGMSQKTASIIAAQLIMKPDSVLGLATGSSPIGTYQFLVKWHQAGYLDFARTISVNLDEYKGLSADHDQSYAYFMMDKLFRHVNIQKENIHIPNGKAKNEDTECRRYDHIIQEVGGIDLQLLGIGHNGHIGFNEPDKAFVQDTHCVALSDSTIEANSRLFSQLEDVPRYAYTMGIRPIMQAKKIVIIASGEGKADIIHKAFQGPVTPEVPASILQLHPDVTLIADKEALSKI